MAYKCKKSAEFLVKISVVIHTKRFFFTNSYVGGRRGPSGAVGGRRGPSGAVGGRRGPSGAVGGRRGPSGAVGEFYRLVGIRLESFQ